MQTSPNDIVRMNPPRNLIDRPAGPTDPEVHFISLRESGADGRPIALLANYSLHYVGGLPAGGVSADYFGVFAGHIEKALGKDFDIRKFHDVVLSLGSVPLPALEARIDAFIADGGQGLPGVTYE